MLNYGRLSETPNYLLAEPIEKTPKKMLEHGKEALLITRQSLGKYRFVFFFRVGLCRLIIIFAQMS